MVVRFLVPLFGFSVDDVVEFEGDTSYLLLLAENGLVEVLS